MVDIIINGNTYNAEEYDCVPVIEYLGDKTTTRDGVNHKGGKKVRRNIKTSFADKSKEETAKLMQDLMKGNITVTYLDSPTNTKQTRIFNLNSNISSPIVWWKPGRERYKGISIDLLEVTAE